MKRAIVITGVFLSCGACFRMNLSFDDFGSGIIGEGFGDAIGCAVDQGIVAMLATQHACYRTEQGLLDLPGSCEVIAHDFVCPPSEEDTRHFYWHGYINIDDRQDGKVRQADVPVDAQSWLEACAAFKPMWMEDIPDEPCDSTKFTVYLTPVPDREKQ